MDEKETIDSNNDEGQDAYDDTHVQRHPCASSETVRLFMIECINTRGEWLKGYDVHVSASSERGMSFIEV